MRYTAYIVYNNYLYRFYWWTLKFFNWFVSEGFNRLNNAHKRHRNHEKIH